MKIKHIHEFLANVPARENQNWGNMFPTWRFCQDKIYIDSELLCKQDQYQQKKITFWNQLRNWITIIYIETNTSKKNIHETNYQIVNILILPMFLIWKYVLLHETSNMISKVEKLVEYTETQISQQDKMILCNPYFRQQEKIYIKPTTSKI